MSLRILENIGFWNKDKPDQEQGHLQVYADVRGTVTDAQLVDTLVRAAEKIAGCEFVKKETP